MSQYFVEAVDEFGDRHWSDVISSDETLASVLDDARSFMSYDISDEQADSLMLVAYLVGEDPVASVKASGGDVILHNREDVA